MKYYDVTFFESNGKSVVKRSVASDKPVFEVWKDACTNYNDKELCLVINHGTKIILNRRYIMETDIEEVPDPIDKNMKRQDEIMTVINSLSSMGF